MVRAWTLRARESFWLMPAVFGISAVVLAEVLIALDRALVDADVSIPFLNAMSASGGRAMLSAVGVSMLTVAGTAFSITISVLATTSSTYGPRLVRNFMADRGNQLVLAVLTSTFLYSVVVLRSLRTEIDGSDAFVPVIAVHLVVLLAMLDVAVLVYFIHHIASSVQVTTLQQRVQEDLTQTVDDLYPADAPPGDTGASTITAHHSRGDSRWERRVDAESVGYVQRVDFPKLVSIAARHDVTLLIDAMPGCHVLPGESLARFDAAPDSASGAEPHSQAGDDLDSGVRSAFTIGDARTPHQDVRFALQQLTEIAVRGLSTGSNDPYTPVGALDAMANGLVPLCTRPPAPDTRFDSDGTLRVICPWPVAEDLLATVFRDIRQYGVTHLGVVVSALDLAERIERNSNRVPVRAALCTEIAALREAFLATNPMPIDRVPLENRFAAVAGALRKPSHSAS